MTIRYSHTFALAILVSLVTIGYASAACPKILLFGIDLAESDPEHWQNSGVDGFFVLNLVTNWQDSVGDDEHGPAYGRARQFQIGNSKVGISDNFLHIYVHNNRWHAAAVNLLSDAQLRQIVGDFRDAAHLARYAGFKGISLDLEDHQGLWSADPNIPDKGERLFQLGKQVGAAIKGQFPAAALIVMPEALIQAQNPGNIEARKEYELSTRFWDGLVQAHFQSLILAPERSYLYERPALILEQTRNAYAPNLAHNGVAPGSVSVALGLWPVGRYVSPENFSLESAPRFTGRLSIAYGTGEPYVWIYSEGKNIWRDRRAKAYLDAIRQVRASCANYAP
ncbi:MAG: hypothetical protein Q7S58_21850 [Candidatus Binatus sp.]|uniref:hypothetical protein n=1 Tax=Candidatus Binatus sp. TaxID=2811406 RepID=UPI002717B753|nr:hypothetical protein [Candidatus Binatus sp.]MDO8435048.1 hypothetical protein [Candidatus Binatus sp.]